MTTPTHSLPDGDEIPAVGAGTWNVASDETAGVVETALDAGYTHVDTAEGYHNEAAVGDAVAGRDREELFLTSKVLPKHLHYDDVLASLEASLDRLGTEYLDLYLIHWPNPAISLRETFHALERAYDEGLVRNVGVSNFSEYQLTFARRVADVPIAVNQIELHPWYYREDLVEYCHAHDVVVEAAAPLARGEFLDDPVVAEVAEKHDRTPAQVALRWGIEKDVVVLPKSTDERHLADNVALFDWELDAEDVARLDAIERHENVYMITIDDEDYGIPP